MSTPIRRNLVLSITSLTIGLVLGCSASETTNTLAPGSGGSNATGGQTGINSGGTSNGGAPLTGGTNGCSRCSHGLCARCTLQWTWAVHPRSSQHPVPLQWRQILLHLISR